MVCERLFISHHLPELINLKLYLKDVNSTRLIKHLYWDSQGNSLGFLHFFESVDSRKRDQFSCYWSPHTRTRAHTHTHTHTQIHTHTFTHTHPLEISNRKIGLSFWPTWDWRNWLALQGQLAPVSTRSTENNFFLIIFSPLKQHTHKLTDCVSFSLHTNNLNASSMCSPSQNVCGFFLGFLYPVSNFLCLMFLPILYQEIFSKNLLLGVKKFSVR